MKPAAAVLALALLAAAAPAQDMAAPLGPLETIAAINAGPDGGVKGRFEMTVAAASKTADATFLNSAEDYRAPENVTFKLRPIVAAMLKKRFGAEPAEYMKGKRVVVDGTARAVMIANTVGGRPTSINRFSAQVAIDQAKQIVLVE